MEVLGAYLEDFRVQLQEEMLTPDLRRLVEVVTNICQGIECLHELLRCHSFFERVIIPQPALAS